MYTGRSCFNVYNLKDLVGDINEQDDLIRTYVTCSYDPLD